MKSRNWVILLGAISLLAIGLWIFAPNLHPISESPGGEQLNRTSASGEQTPTTGVVSAKRAATSGGGVTDGVHASSRVKRTIETPTLHVSASWHHPRIAAISDLAALLVRAEKGDHEAAYSAARFLSECNLLTVADPSATRQGGESGDTILPPELVALRPECEKLPQRYRAKRIALFEQAAEAGNELAQVAYVSEASDILLDPVRVVQDPDAVQRYRDRALRFLLAASAKGNVDAMLNLAFTYEQGLLSVRDQVLAYAYALAVRNSGLSRGADGVVSLWMNQLSEQERRRAELIAREILGR